MLAIGKSNRGDVGPVNTRRTLFLAGLVLAAALVVAVMPALAQNGGDCPTCPVSFTGPSTLDPHSPSMLETNKLFDFILVMAGMVFVLVEGALILTVLRFRNRPASEAVQLHGNTKLEIAWTAVPGVILAVLLGFTLRSMAVIRAPVTGDSIKVVAIGHQWWWEFQYPELGIITANQLVVPVGTVVEVELHSKDVQHGFWVPQLFGKMDAIPAHTNRMHFTVDSAGEYGGQCTQFCGEEHAQMRFSVVGVSAAEFQAWAANQQQPASAPSGDAATRGQKAFMSGACVSCHTIGGTSAAGKIGPNLTHLASRNFIAGGVLYLTEDNLKLWIQNPQAIKLGAIMPNLGLAPDTVSDMAAYLSTLK